MVRLVREKESLVQSMKEVNIILITCRVMNNSSNFSYFVNGIFLLSHTTKK